MRALIDWSIFIQYVQMILTVPLAILASLQIARIIKRLVRRRQRVELRQH